ncbi:MAG TPA: histidine phosphatase family protein [Solirubrobacteraceae bacterium]|nr:histidine phosphatase family protein [Solirubrobacteraceae bacterium]
MSDSGSSLYLARHGRTAYNHERRFQGRLPVALDAVGIAQAQTLAREAAAVPFTALFSSPLRRARETADIVAAALGLPVREDERLMETDAGAWTDMPFAEVSERWPEEFRRFAQLDPTFAFPEGESFAAQQQRVAAALVEVSAGALPALVICHGVVIRLALRAFGAQAPPRIENGALVALSLPASGADLR